MTHFMLCYVREQLTTRSRGRTGRIGRNVHGVVTSEDGAERAPVGRTTDVAVPLSTYRTVYEMIVQVKVYLEFLLLQRQN